MITRVLAEHQAGTTHTRSELEEGMLELCRRFELPSPLVNQEIEGYTVDFVWPEAARHRGDRRLAGARHPTRLRE